MRGLLAHQFNGLNEGDKSGFIDGNSTSLGNALDNPNKTSVRHLLPKDAEEVVTVSNQGGREELDSTEDANKNLGDVLKRTVLVLENKDVRELRDILKGTVLLSPQHADVLESQGIGIPAIEEMTRGPVIPLSEEAWDSLIRMRLVDWRKGSQLIPKDIQKRCVTEILSKYNGSLDRFDHHELIRQAVPGLLGNLNEAGVSVPPVVSVSQDVWESLVEKGIIEGNIEGGQIPDCIQIRTFAKIINRVRDGLKYYNYAALIREAIDDVLKVTPGCNDVCTKCE